MRLEWRFHDKGNNNITNAVIPCGRAVQPRNLRTFVMAVKDYRVKDRCFNKSNDDDYVRLSCTQKRTVQPSYSTARQKKNKNKETKLNKNNRNLVQG